MPVQEKRNSAELFGILFVRKLLLMIGIAAQDPEYQNEYTNKNKENEFHASV